MCAPEPLFTSALVVVSFEFLLYARAVCVCSRTAHAHICVCAYMCVCVCVKNGERKRGARINAVLSKDLR